MFHDDSNSDSFIRDLIRRKARQLVGRAGFTKFDVEDIAQELYLKLVKHLGAFDPDQGHLHAFVTTVVERHVATMLRDKRAAKRDHRRISSLNVMVEITDEQPTELAQTVSRRELEARLGCHRRSQEEITQLAIDLADLIATLPEPWRRLLELRKSRSMAQAAREMGVPRTTLNDWMRFIRLRFEQAGMRDYLK